MLVVSIKQFIKPTFSKIITMIILIIFFILSRSLVMRSSNPVDNLFFKIDLIIFKPAEYIANIFSNYNFYYLGNIVYFIVDLSEYYLMACILIFVFKKIKFKK